MLKENVIITKNISLSYSTCEFKIYQDGWIFLMLYCLLMQYLKWWRVRNGKRPLDLCCCREDFAAFRNFLLSGKGKNTKIRDWWNLWFFFQVGQKQHKKRDKKSLCDALTADTLSGPSTLGIDMFGSQVSDIALLKTIHTHMSWKVFWYPNT